MFFLCIGLTCIKYVYSCGDDEQNQYPNKDNVPTRDRGRFIYGITISFLFDNVVIIHEDDEDDNNNLFDIIIINFNVIEDNFIFNQENNNNNDADHFFRKSKKTL